MKKIALITLITVLSSPVIYAQNSGFIAAGNPVMNNIPNVAYPQAGGFTGPGTGTITIKQAKSMRDDSWVTLRGHLERRISGDLYLFRDETGTINVDIDEHYWYGKQVTPKDKIELRGEIDKDWDDFRPVEIDVKQLTKIG